MKYNITIYDVYYHKYKLVTYQNNNKTEYFELASRYIFYKREREHNIFFPLLFRRIFFTGNFDLGYYYFLDP